MQVVVETADLDALHEVLNGAYTRMRIEARCVPRTARLATASLGPIRFDELCLPLTLRADADPLHSHVFGLLTSGRLQYRSEGEERRIAPGDSYLCARPYAPLTVDTHETDLDLIVFEESAFDGVTDAPVRFTSLHTVSARAVTAWRSAWMYVRDEVQPQFAGNALVEANAVRLLTAATLAAFPNTALEHPANNRDAHPQALKRAIAFIESRADQDIGVADIARAARVTIRSVQLAFRRHLGTTPMGYLRQVRLSCAHADLLNATPGDTVTMIAARWGYARPSVFAAHYRTSYGTSPSRTLRSSFSR